MTDSSEYSIDYQGKVVAFLGVYSFKEAKLLEHNHICRAFHGTKNINEVYINCKWRSIKDHLFVFHK